MGDEQQDGWKDQVARDRLALTAADAAISAALAWRVAPVCAPAAPADGVPAPWTARTVRFDRWLRSIDPDGGENRDRSPLPPH